MSGNARRTGQSLESGTALMHQLASFHIGRGVFYAHFFLHYALLHLFSLTAGRAFDCAYAKDVSPGGGTLLNEVQTLHIAMAI